MYKKLISNMLTIGDCSFFCAIKKYVACSFVIVIDKQMCT